MSTRINRIPAALLFEFRTLVRRSSQSSAIILIFFTTMAIILRWSGFYRSVIDSSDESLYLLVARAWSEGHPPYTNVWDNKPPGIYLIFLIAMSLIGESVFTIRILACVFVALTCFFLYEISRLTNNPHGRMTGLIAGIFYVILTLGNGGMASNTELFFVAFVVFAFYYLFARGLRFGDSPVDFFAISVFGFFLGLAFEIKYVVLFDFIAGLLLLAGISWTQIQSGFRFGFWLKSIAFLTLGFLLPVVLVSLYFWGIGHFESYFYANFTANKLRTLNLDFSFMAALQAVLDQIRTHIIFWLAVPIVTVYLLVEKDLSRRERLIVSSFVLFFFVDLAGIYIVFRSAFYPHYFLQLSAFLSFITAYMITLLVFSKKAPNRINFRGYLLVCLMLVLVSDQKGVFRELFHNANHVYSRHLTGSQDPSVKQDSVALVAEYLKPRITPADYIYVVPVDSTIIYFLANAKIPTRYPFSRHLIVSPELPRIANVDPVKELERILSKRPIYIVMPKRINSIRLLYNRKFFSKLDLYLAKYYQLEHSIGDAHLYRLMSHLLTPLG